MRGLGSRLAALALALPLGAAGAHSLGTPSPTDAACSADALAADATVSYLSTAGVGLRVAPAGGWERAETERTGSRPVGDHACRLRPHASAPPRRALIARSRARGLPVRGSVGLLGLHTSPANAPPGS